MPKRRTKITIDGQTYASLADAARQNNINVHTLQNRYYNGKRGHDLIIKAGEMNTLSKPITIQNITYPSITEAARQNNMPAERLIARIRYNWDDEDLFKPVYFKSKNHDGSPIEINGHVYSSIIDAAKDIGISTSILRYRINHGYSDEDLIKKTIVETNENGKVVSKRPMVSIGKSKHWVTIGNKRYVVADAAKKLHSSRTSILRYLKQGMSGDDIQAYLIEKRKHLKYKNQSIYRSNLTAIIENKEMTFEEISKKYHIQLSTLQSRYHQGLRHEQLLAGYNRFTPKIIHDENEAFTIKEIAEKYDTPVARVYTYVKNNYSDKDIIDCLKDVHLKTFDTSQPKRDIRRYVKFKSKNFDIFKYMIDICGLQYQDALQNVFGTSTYSEIKNSGYSMNTIQYSKIQCFMNYFGLTTNDIKDIDNQLSKNKLK